MRNKNGISHVAFLIGPTGKITTWNAACQRMFGYPKAQVLLRPLASLLGEAARAPYQERLRQLGGDAQRLDVDLIHADGSVVPYQLILVPQFRKSGQFSYYSVIVGPAGAYANGMSEPERIGRTPLREMVDFLAGTFYVINQHGRMVMWNHRVEQATQLGPDELGAIDVLHLFNQEQRALVADKIAEVFLHDGEVVVEADLCSRDGRTTPYLFSGSRFASAGQFYLCGMGLDISEMRSQGEQLRLRERALHASSNGIVITRCAGRDNPVEYVNPAFERITGYRAAEVLGRDMRFMAVAGLDDAERAKLRAAVNERRDVNVVFRNLRKNGEVFWNNLKVTPVLDERGRASHFIGVLDDVTASIHRTTHLEHALNHDTLTGLASRNLLWDRLEQALHVAQRNKSLVAAVLVDLDNFKNINDSFGHDAGDEVLRVVARRLQGSVRESDTVARLGGDEFVLVLDNQPSLRFTLRMIERLRQDLAKPVVLDGREIDVGASMGVSIFPHDAASAVEMIQAADVAMYHAKAAGRNDVHFFSAEMKATTEAKHKLEASLRNAVEKGELFLALQPRVCLRSGRIVGAEALLRWRHPEQGVLLPAAFIPDAEENGLIIPLGAWVFGTVCRMMQELRARGFDNLVMSMNVSFRELNQKNFARLIGDQLSQSKLPPGLIELEVKESYLLRNPQMAREVLVELGKLGLKLTIDEFGAGVSSLSHLQALPVSHIKIPQPFIQSINEQRADGMLVKTMIGIGHNMNIDVIAEGVETSGQMHFLRQNDCDEIQGNFFSEPVCLQAFEQLLSEGAAAPGAGPDPALAS
jgi:diguanylate cyclase (GGDEF)-like protein/PAS domain S-box-containing protein